MSMAIPSCLLQLEKTAIINWDGSGRISMQQFRLCHCVLYTHYHSFVTLGAVSCPDRGNATLFTYWLTSKPNGFNLTRVNTSLTSLVSYLILLIWIMQDCISQFNKLIQYNVKGNISKFAAVVSFSFFLFVLLAV